jgi:hypothetical protein
MIVGAFLKEKDLWRNSGYNLLLEARKEGNG